MQGTQQQHFLLCIRLMLFFFVVSQIEQAAFALHWTATLIGNGSVDKTFELFLGIAIGIFRGMTPDHPLPLAPKSDG
jgi:hypothetical protein